MHHVIKSHDGSRFCLFLNSVGLDLDQSRLIKIPNRGRHGQLVDQGPILA